MMIVHLTDLINNFPGGANQTCQCCFAHILSIAAKAIIKQFDVLKVKKGKVLNEAAEALAKLANRLDLEECAERGVSGASEGNDELLNPGEEFHNEMSKEQMKALDVSVWQV